MPPLHLLVVTNASEDGAGKGTLNTQRMLESWGRSDTIPQVTKRVRTEQARQSPQTPHVSYVLAF